MSHELLTDAKWALVERHRVEWGQMVTHSAGGPCPCPGQQVVALRPLGFCLCVSEQSLTARVLPAAKGGGGVLSGQQVESGNVLMLLVPGGKEQAGKRHEDVSLGGTPWARRVAVGENPRQGWEAAAELTPGRQALGGPAQEFQGPEPGASGQWVPAAVWTPRGSGVSSMGWSGVPGTTLVLPVGHRALHAPTCLEGGHGRSLVWKGSSPGGITACRFSLRPWL